MQRNKRQGSLEFFYSTELSGSHWAQQLQNLTCLTETRKGDYFKSALNKKQRVISSLTTPHIADTEREYCSFLVSSPQTPWACWNVFLCIQKGMTSKMTQTNAKRRNPAQTNHLKLSAHYLVNQSARYGLQDDIQMHKSPIYHCSSYHYTQ